MGNFRNKLRRAGCMEVAVNAGKWSKSNPDNEPSHLNIKRARHAEVNYLPDFPQSHDASTLEQQRVEITEVEKAEKILLLLIRRCRWHLRYAGMRSLPVHHQWKRSFDAGQLYVGITSIIKFNCVLKKCNIFSPFVTCFSCLLFQVCAEFQRITNQNLTNTFYAELDRHSFCLMTLYRQRAAKTGKTANALADFFQVHDLILSPIVV